jgi:hypothetical protein
MRGDDTPSRVITPKTNLWQCFGCDAGGTVIDWVMRSHRVSFRHACNTDDKTQTIGFGDWRNGPRVSNSGVSCYGNCGLNGYLNDPLTIINSETISVPPDLQADPAHPFGPTTRITVTEVFVAGVVGSLAVEVLTGAQTVRRFESLVARACHRVRG